MTTPAQTQAQDSWTRTTVLACLLVALGQMLQASKGNYSPAAIRWLVLSSLLGGLALAGPPWRVIERFGLRAPAAVLLAGLMLQFSQVMSQQPGDYLQGSGGWQAFQVVAGAAAVVAGSVAFASVLWSRLGIALLAFCFFLAGIGIVNASPLPRVDVFVFQQVASDALLDGRNPYTLTFDNIYGNSTFYGPGLTDGKTLFFGFPYPPLSLFFSTLGFLTTGDYRSAQVVALAIAGLCLGANQPNRLGALAAATLLFTPRSFYVIELGWTEPYGLALLGLVLLTALRAPKFLWLALGALFAWKQYTPLLLPLTVLLLPRPFNVRAWLRIVVPAVALVFVLTLPLALWNVPGFWRSVIFCQTVQPFRSDALSYPAFLLAFGHTPPPVLPTCLALTTLAIAVALWRAPRTPQGFATAATVVLGVFFAFNKQSFCNYWFLVLGCSALAIGAGRLKPEAPVEPGLQPAPGA